MINKMDFNVLNIPGDDNISISYLGLIGDGGYGEVHKVLPIRTAVFTLKVLRRWQESSLPFFYSRFDMG